MQKKSFSSQRIFKACILIGQQNLTYAPKRETSIITVYFILKAVLTFLIERQNLTYAPEREAKFQNSLFQTSLITFKLSN